MSGTRTLRKGEVVLNRWAGYKTYFVCLNTVKADRYNRMVRGLAITEIDGKKEIRIAEYYFSSLMDKEHYPTIGFIDTDKILDIIVQDDASSATPL